MAIHVQDEEADRLLREFARRRGVGITAAIRIAVHEASEREVDQLEAFMARVRPVLDRAKARTAESASCDRVSADDKAFMDEMWGEDD